MAAAICCILPYQVNTKAVGRSRNRNLFPPEWVTTFRRDAVESYPEEISASLIRSQHSDNYYDEDEDDNDIDYHSYFGDRSLPLRDAVESSPAE